MKRMGLSSVLACACAVAAVAAQDKPVGKDVAEKIIVTGCLQSKGPDSPHGAWILINASATADTSSAAGSPNASSAPRPVIGTSGAKAGAGVDYRLEGMADDLAKHAGKRVEIRGSIARQGTIAANPSAATGTSGVSPMPLVHVREVHTVAGDCKESQK
jgi:hypothetical protein